MLHRFATYEEAALFVAKKRDDGYYAEILHDNVSTFWGPLVIGGISAWVSECAAEEGELVELPDAKLFDLPQEVSTVVGGVVIAVAGIVTALLLLSLLMTLSHYPLQLLLLLGYLALYGVVLATIGYCGSEFTRVLRDPDAWGHEIAHWILGLLMPFMVLAVLSYF